MNTLFIIGVWVVVLLIMQWALGAYLVGMSLLAYAFIWLLGAIEFVYEVSKVLVIHYWERWQRRERKPVRW